MSSQDVSKPPSPLSQTPTGAATAIPELGDIIRENQLIPIGTTYFSPTITIRPDSPEHASLRSLVDRLSSQTGDSELDTGRSNRAALPSSKGDHEEQSTMPSAQQFQTDSSNGSATPSAKRPFTSEAGNISDSHVLDARPAKRFKGPEVSEEVSGDAIEVPEPPKVLVKSPTPAVVPATQQTRIHNRLGPPEPKNKWKKQFNIYLTNEQVQIQWYNAGDGENARQLRQDSLPRELLDKMFQHLELSHFQKIFVDHSRLLVGREMAEKMLGDSLILMLLEKEGFPLQAIYCPGKSKCGPEGGFNLYDVLCVVVGYGCQVCGETMVRIVDWKNLVRICNSCRSEHIIDSHAARQQLQQADFAHPDRIEKLLECIVAYTGQRNRIQYRYFYDAAVDTIAQEYRKFEAIEDFDGVPHWEYDDGVRTFDDWCSTQHWHLGNLLRSSLITEGWQGYAGFLHRNALRAAKDQRIADIKARVAAMQPPTAISVRVLEKCKSFQNQRSNSKPLTEKSWITLEAKIISEAREFRLNTIKRRMKDWIKSPILEALSIHCPSFKAEMELKSTKALTFNEWSRLKCNIEGEGDKIRGALRARCDAICATNPQFFAQSTQILLMQSATWRQHLGLDTFCDSLEVLTQAEIQAVATAVQQEVYSYQKAQSKARQLSIFNAVCHQAPQTHSALLKQCPAYKAQAGFATPIASEQELGVIINTILGEVSARNVRLNHIYHAVRQQAPFPIDNSHFNQCVAWREQLRNWTPIDSAQERNVIVNVIAAQMAINFVLRF